VRERAEGNPVAAGLFVLAAGFFVGSLLPPTERERELTRRARSEIEPLKDQLAETGRGIAGELSQSAQQNQGHLDKAPLLLAWPGLAITLMVLSFDLAGDGLRDFLDPRTESRR
jgi:hypothetical protein